MTQVVFTWSYGGRIVELAGAWNDWHPERMEKQGNYFHKILQLGNGVHHYKFVVDGVWLYDLSQANEDDGSGNWNNYIEIGTSKAGRKAHEVESFPAKKQQHQPQQHQPQQHQPQQHQQQQQQQNQKNQQQQQQNQQQKKKETPPKKEPVAKTAPTHPKGGVAGSGKGKKPEPEPVPEPEQEPEPEKEVETTEPETPAPTPAPTPAAPEAKAKVLESIVEIDVVGADIDTDMGEVEKFVRALQLNGLTWQGGKVTPHVFGLNKLSIICKCRDDVSVEEDVCKVLEVNEELIGSAQIMNFSC